MQLVSYGILEEQSDYRVHVCLKNGKAYVFKTADGRAACMSKKYETRLARQSGIAYATANGFIIPKNDIADCREVILPDDICETINYDDHSTTEKGNEAVRVTKELLLRGLLPIALTGKAIEEKALQIKGLDIVVSCEIRLQIKCDNRIAETGNLYLQIAESNPLRQY